ncbi:MAG: hypothetical protein REI94_15290 [Moraxellaceae bacterium]|nr:hypothetical protein [Moraxellaceae bacterium]
MAVLLLGGGLASPTALAQPAPRQDRDRERREPIQRMSPSDRDALRQELMERRMREARQMSEQMNERMRQQMERQRQFEREFERDRERDRERMRQAPPGRGDDRNGPRDRLQPPERGEPMRRLSPEERRQLRRDVRDAYRD